MFRKILVALDGSEVSQRALESALELGTQLGAAVTVLSVVERLPAYAATVGETDEAKNHATGYFDELQIEAVRLAAKHGIDLSGEVRYGHAAERIVEFAKEGGFDLIILGGKGHSI